jgi:hypothetical protein
MAPTAEATTSARGSLTSGCDHLSTDNSGPPHRWTVAASARVKRSSLPSSHGVRTRPSKNAASTPAAYSVLYGPLVRPVVREKPWMWRTHARRDRRPCGGRTAMPRPSVGGSPRAIRAREPGTRQLTALAAGRPRVAEVHLLLKAGERLLPQMLEEEAGHRPMRKVGPQLGSPPTLARMMNILEAEGRREAAARLSSPHHKDGSHPSG